jgi:hypothetical protein
MAHLTVIPPPSQPPSTLLLCVFNHTQQVYPTMGPRPVPKTRFGTSSQPLPPRVVRHHDTSFQMEQYPYKYVAKGAIFSLNMITGTFLVQCIPYYHPILQPGRTTQLLQQRHRHRPWPIPQPSIRVRLGLTRLPRRGLRRPEITVRWPRLVTGWCVPRGLRLAHVVAPVSNSRVSNWQKKEDGGAFDQLTLRTSDGRGR